MEGKMREMEKGEGGGELVVGVGLAQGKGPMGEAKERERLVRREGLQAGDGYRLGGGFNGGQGKREDVEGVGLVEGKFS
ncbi:hypothetical protein Ancab_001388 [Ancistrocladus abbreviatus]